MISDLRAIAALALIGVALLIALLRAPNAHPIDRTVVPGFDPATVRSLTWLGPPERLIVREGDHWKMMGQPLPIEPRYLADLLSSLRSARWHRRDAAARHRFRGGLELDRGATATTIALGEPLAGTDQVWIAVDHGEALLVDGWLAKFFAPSSIAMFAPAPFEDAGREASIEVVIGDDAVGQVVLQTHPYRAAGALVEPELGDALVAALAGVQLVGLSTTPAVATSRVKVGARTVPIGGTCSGHTRVAIWLDPTMKLPACIELAAWQAITAAVAALDRPPADIMDRRPAGFAIDHVELASGTLSLVRRPMFEVAGTRHRIDPDRVSELVGALAERGEPAPVPPGAPAFTLVVTPVAGLPVSLDVFATAVHRRGEPLALRISPAARAVLARPVATLFDSERWREEPSTLSELTLDTVTYRRGAVLGEWTREPAGRFDPTLVEMLAAAAAKLTAPAARGTFTALHTLQLRFSPPVGAPIMRELAVGAVNATNGACAGQLEGERVSLPAELCTALAAVAAR